LRILRFQGFRARKCFRGILTPREGKGEGEG
jgi:hypothetical protein